MDELLELSVGMMEEQQEEEEEEEEGSDSLLRRPSLKESFHRDSLLPPDSDFLTDDHSSAASGLDVVDRLTYLEQRMQMQEDEIQMLKMALADVLKRLNISEEQRAATAASAASAAPGKRAAGVKARPVSLALPTKPSTVLQTSAPLKKSSMLTSGSPARTYSPTPAHSFVKSPPGSVKDSPCKTAKTRPPAAAAASACKKTQESKSKEATATAGTRRVTHCKVTMQISLSPHSRKTGSSESEGLASAVPTGAVPASQTKSDPQAKEGGRREARRSPPSLPLNQQKTKSGHKAQQEASSFRSPIKSPSHYFQICY